MTSKQLRCTVIIPIAVYCYEHAGDDGNGHDHFSESGGSGRGGIVVGGGGGW